MLDISASMIHECLIHSIELRYLYKVTLSTAVGSITSVLKVKESRSSVVIFDSRSSHSLGSSDFLWYKSESTN